MSESPDRSGVAVTDLRVEHETAPNNVPPERPRLSWRGETDRRGAGQTAYRVVVAHTERAAAEGRGELWDSGRVESADATGVRYGGVPLESGTDYYWTVRLWDERGEPSEWAEPAAFSTAPAGRREWDGAWIGYRPAGGDSNGYRSEWHPGGADAEEWVQVDLGEQAELDSVVLHPAEPFDGPETPDGLTVSSVYSEGEADVIADEGPAGFGFPVRYRVEAADDPGFESARTVADRTDEGANPGTEPVVLDGDGTARYVRVTATELHEVDPGDGQLKTEYVREERRPWQVFALAALAVRDDDGEDLAAGAAVTASSTVETATWGREKLVDGRYDSRTVPGSPLLRTEVDLGGEVERARAHFCGLGYGELYVNGEKAGDDLLNPGWTQYDERVLYSSYDVADRLDRGENAVGIWLGEGWFGRNARDWTGFGAPRALLQIEIEYADGRTRTVSTGGDWRGAQSPLVAADLYDGERYDARREQPGWAEPGFDDAGWETAAVVHGPGGDLVPQRTPPIRVTETVEPAELVDREEGPIVDFGQNLVGWVELTVEGADRGDEIEVRHAEVLREDGSLDLVDLRSADATDSYVAAGDGPESYEPRFTYHGFRYAQVVGYPGDLDPGDVTAKVVHTDLERIGAFDCSNDDLARVQENARWGLRGNVHSVLTDCPQRDERFGWTGDNQIAARALAYNFDVARFYEKWSEDHDDAQSEHGYVADTVPYGFGTVPEDPTWGVTRVTVPWHLYCHYGDRGVLENHYGAMRRYVDFWWAESEGGIVPGEYGNYGDWLAFENADGRRGLPFDLFNTAFQYHTTDLFGRIADVLDNDADSGRYAARAEEMAAAFNERFLDADAGRYGPGTQSSYAVPLYFGLVPDEHADRVAANLAEKVRADGGKLRTGFLGTRPLLFALVEYGYADLAYEVVSQPERPGWVYMVRQGATTMWERWDSDDRIGDGMNSFNHSPFNFVSEWFYAALAGLRFDDSIVEGVEVAPAIIEDLDWAEGSIRTGNGRFASRWERTGNGVVLDVEVPWNTTATVRLPGDADGVTVLEGAGGVEERRDGDGPPVLTVGAGTYRFEVGD